MSIISKKKIFYIDSRARASGTDSDFTMQLNINTEDNFDSAVILECIIPKSYWLVPKNRNTFQLSENGIVVTIIVPVGNYNRRSFATQIQSLLNSASPHSYSYSIKYPNSLTDPDTGYYTYTVSGNGGVQPLFIFSTFLFEQFGFNKNSTNIFSSNTLVSSNVIKLQLEDTIYIHSDMISNSGNDNVLQHVFCSAGSGNFSNIHFQTNGDVEAYSKKLLSHNSNVFRFYICDEEDNPIDLNGLNMSMILMLYKKNTVIEDAMKVMTYELVNKQIDQVT